VKSLAKKIKDKVAYERESFRMGQEHLKKIAEETPFPPFRQRIRMTPAEVEQWRREQRKRG